MRRFIYYLVAFLLGSAMLYGGSKQAIALDEAGDNNVEAQSASLLPTFARSFTPNTVAPGDVATLSVTITNPSDTALTSLSFNEAALIQTGLINTNTGTCDGAFIYSLGYAYSVNNVSLAPHSSCTYTVDFKPYINGTFASTISNPYGFYANELGGFLPEVFETATLIVDGPTGTISGTVTHASVPVPYTMVIIQTGDNLYEQRICADTAGQYTVSGLPLNTPIFIRNYFNCDGAEPLYLNEWWQDAYNQWEATPVTLSTAAPAISDINLTLEVGATISGTVYAADTMLPIPGASVEAAHSNGIANTVADANGHYTLTGLGYGAAYVRAIVTDLYVQEFWQEFYRGDGTPIILSPEVTHVDNIDFTLARRGVITGTVYDENGTPQGGIFMELLAGQTLVANYCTQPNGDYYFTQAPQGETLYIRTAEYNWCGGSMNFEQEYWEDAAGFNDATPIILTPELAWLEDMDFVLAPLSPPAVPVMLNPIGVITETNPYYEWTTVSTARSYRVIVTDTNNVTVIDTPPLFFFCLEVCGITWTPLPPGTYFVRVEAANNAGSTSSESVSFTISEPATSTPTPTNTPTYTPTFTETPTFTPTFTATPTFTETPTFTPTFTETPSPTPTHTPFNNGNGNGNGFGGGNGNGNGNGNAGGNGNGNGEGSGDGSGGGGN